MDQKIRNLLILLAVLVLLVIGYAVIGLVVPDEAVESESEEPTPTAVFRVTENGLTAIAYTYDEAGDGVPELWSYRSTTDEAGTITWYWTEDRNIPLGAYHFTSMAETLAQVTPVKILTDVTPEKLAEYGLTDAPRTVTFTDKVGGEQSFSFGTYNAYNGTYCALINGDTTCVYLLEKEICEAFSLPVERFVSYDDLPACEPEELQSVTFTRGDRTVTVTRTPLTVEGETGTDADATYGWMRSVNGAPAVRVADGLTERIHTLLGDMDYLGCYGVSREDFPTYGLDADTTTMTVVYEKTVGGTPIDKTFTLTLGGTYEGYDYYYANPDGTTLTMLLGGDIWHKLITYTDEAIAAGDSADSAGTADTAP